MQSEGGAPTAAAPAPGQLMRVTHDALCVTRGEVTSAGDLLRVEAATTRAVAEGSSGEVAALRFTYRGETKEVAKLASGQIRHQLGVKLRAADGCNVIYAIWRMEPTPFLEVSVKRNPGKRTHAECGAKGYTKMKPERSAKLPQFAEGTSNLLEAAIEGDTLTAWVNGEVVWRGNLDPGARDLHGPAGFRSDNVRFDAELDVAPSGPRAFLASGCTGDGGED